MSCPLNVLDVVQAFVRCSPRPRKDEALPVLLSCPVASIAFFDASIGLVLLLSHSKYFGRDYVIMALPPSMPCEEEESPSSECSPEEGGIGYARHFIQRWSRANRIPFVWMLDDNVQACHELNVETAEGKYEPCSFTHVMNSLERLMLAGDSEAIVVPTAPNSRGTPRSIRQYADGKRVPNACPPESDAVRRGGKPETPPRTGRTISTVGDLCGRPGHYGVIGIARHRHGVGNNNEENGRKPFGVTHSVYSFCLLNVDSTVSKRAFYPMKRFWEDVEFNHIVDERRLVVCMFRKFSHSKKNLQPLQNRRPLPSGPEFQHKHIALAELRKWHQRGSDNDIDLKHSGGLLRHLSEHVLRLLPVEVVLRPTGDDNDKIATGGRSFEIEPVVRMAAGPIPGVTIVPGSGSVLVELRGGIRNESFGVLKGLVKAKVSEGCGTGPAPMHDSIFSRWYHTPNRCAACVLSSGLNLASLSPFQMSVREGTKVVIVTRLPTKRGTGKHIGTWLQEQKEKGWSVEVTTGPGRGSTRGTADAT